MLVMGYSEHQRQEMEKTIHRATGDLVLIATPFNLGLILNIDKPFRGVRYEVVCRTWQILARAVAHDPQFCREGSSRPRLVDRYRTAQTSAPVLPSPERSWNPLQRNSRPVIRIAPPLVITREEIDRALDRIRKVLI
jgi:hypothetical protein